MNALELLHEVTAKNAQIRTDGVKLFVALPPELNTELVIKSIRDQKQELVRILRRVVLTFTLEDYKGGVYLSGPGDSLRACIDQLVERYGTRLVKVTHHGVVVYQRATKN